MQLVSGCGLPAGCWLLATGYRFPGTGPVCLLAMARCKAERVKNPAEGDPGADGSDFKVLAGVRRANNLPEDWPILLSTMRLTQMLR